MNRPRWACRLFGHRYLSPTFGTVVHFYVPSAEGHERRLIGRCKCGAEWWSR